MSKSPDRGSKKTDLPPGSFDISKDKSEKPLITVIEYDQSNYEEKEVEEVEECFPIKDRPTVTWVNVNGIHEKGVIEEIGKQFELHPLILEDILNVEQRQKIEDYDDYVFGILRLYHFDEEKDTVNGKQISFILGKSFVITFQEGKKDFFDSLKERIRAGRGRIRKEGTDYLAYALMDAVVDSYYLVLEKLNDWIEDLEEKVLEEPTIETLKQIQDLKGELVELRKSAWSLREAIRRIERGELSLVKDKTIFYFRDVYDHSIQAVETLETQRELLSGLLDIYLSSTSNKMNEVMKVLTVIATIFIPLTFIAGVYGMNFAHMPELAVKWAYPAILITMGVIFVAMMVYFRSKEWI